MADHGLICFISRAGNVWDKAAMESFFSSLEIQGGRRINRTRDETMAGVFDCIERFYNANHKHSTIGCRSPRKFEMEAGLALQGVIVTGSSPATTANVLRCADCPMLRAIDVEVASQTYFDWWSPK